MNYSKKAILMVMALFCLNLLLLAQSISLNISDVSVKQAITELKNKSGYSFVYLAGDIDTKKQISVNATQLADAVNQILQGQNVSYEIKGTNIIIQKSNSRLTDSKKKQQISGTVKDPLGEPIIGANIMEKGTTNGVITDINGKFSMFVTENSLLQISYIGYLNEEIRTKKTDGSIAIVLREDTKTLEEVVVVGYGTQRRGSVTGSVASADNKDIIKAPVADLTSSLAGRLPGVRAINRSGEPGYNGSEIDIRGFGAALIIVDGVPSEFSQLDANEIENISILKDASAAVYGVKAANGVVLVTTKKGKSEKTRINLNSTFSWQQPTIYPKMVNAAQYAELIDEDKMNRGLPVIYGPEELQKWREGAAGYKSTDWLKEVKKEYAPQQQYNLNVRGGKEDLKYFASLGYMEQQGMWKSGSNNYNRFNFRTNVDAKIALGFSTSISLSGRKETRNSPYSESSNSSSEYIMNAVQRNAPTFAPYANGNKLYPAETNVTAFNPIILTDKQYTGYYKEERKVFEGSLALNYDASTLVKGLNLKALYYYRFMGNTEKIFRKKYNLYKYNEANDSYAVSYVGNNPSRLRQNYKQYEYNTFQGSISYDRVFAEKHAVNGLFLFETKEGNDGWFQATREFIIDTIDELNAGVDANKNNSGSSYSEGSIGYVGRLNYAYDTKYLFEFSFRYDGSSKFPSNSRWGFFPSVSGGWRLSEENFIRNKISFLNDLKLRASWGKLGDDSGISAFQYLSGYTYPSGNYIFGDKVTSTLVNKGLANTNITWYTSDLYNIGLDFTLWNGLLGGEIDLFYRKRNGLMSTRVTSLPGTFGASLPQENLNSDSDRGFEIVLHHNNRISSKLSYSVKGNVSFTRSKNEYVERAESINAYNNWRNNSNSRWKNIYWGYKALGQFQSYDEIANAPVQDSKGNTTLRPGDIKYADYNNDNIIDDNDVHVIGRGTKPEFFFGLDLGLSWKGFDASIFLQGAANFNTYFTNELQTPFYNNASSLAAFTDRWHRKDLYDPNSEWIAGNYPSTYAGGLESNRKVSTFWLQNASYLRVKDIQIGYTIPKATLNRYGLETFRVFMSGYNLLTFTGLDLMDPEVPEGRGQYYPQQKVLSVGFNLSF